MKVSDIVAVAALSLSVVSLYYAVFYEKRELLVTWGEIEFSESIPNKLKLPLVFINQGNRNEAITSIRVRSGDACYAPEKFKPFTVISNGVKIVNISHTFKANEYISCLGGGENSVVVEVEYIRKDGSSDEKYIEVAELHLNSENPMFTPSITYGRACLVPTGGDIRESDCENSIEKPASIKI